MLAAHTHRPDLEARRSRTGRPELDRLRTRRLLGRPATRPNVIVLLPPPPHQHLRPRQLVADLPSLGASLDQPLPGRPDGQAGKCTLPPPWRRSGRHAFTPRCAQTTRKWRHPQWRYTRPWPGLRRAASSPPSGRRPLPARNASPSPDLPWRSRIPPPISLRAVGPGCLWSAYAARWCGQRNPCPPRRIAP